jgi:hypothetical protein
VQNKLDVKSDWMTITQMETIKLPASEAKETKVFGKLKGFPCVFDCEPAGSTFHMGFIKKTEKKETHETNSLLSEQYSEEYMRKKTQQYVDEEDYYGLLDLVNREKSTLEEIKKGYKIASIKYHPDKMGKDGKSDDTLFKMVQQAHDTLSSERKKRLYDSKDPHFDPSTPYYQDSMNFYKVFGPRFDAWKKYNFFILIFKMVNQRIAIHWR